jgi:hypothetical protein
MQIGVLLADGTGYIWMQPEFLTSIETEMNTGDRIIDHVVVAVFIFALL